MLSNIKTLLLSVILVCLTSAADAGFMITEFVATNDNGGSNTWNGFGFQITGSDPVSVYGMGLIDYVTLDTPAGIKDDSIGYLWRRIGTADDYEILATATFNAGVSAPLIESDDFQYGGSTPGLEILGYRVVDFNDGSDIDSDPDIIELIPGEIYILAARAPGASGQLPHFQDNSSITVESPFQILSSEAAAGGASEDAAGRSPDTFGLTGLGMMDNNAFPFMSQVDFNPIVVTLNTSTVNDLEEEYSPPDPVVPEPSSAVLMGLGTLCGLGVYRRRRAA